MNFENSDDTAFPNPNTFKEITEKVGESDKVFTDQDIREAHWKELEESLFIKPICNFEADPITDSTILKEADAIAGQSGDRGKEYGGCTENFTRTADLLNALGFRFVDNKDRIVEVEAKHFPLIMIAIKLARIMNSKECYHNDSYKDIAGYVKTADLVHLGL